MKRIVLGMAVLTVLLAACGSDGASSPDGASGRTIKVRMIDNEFNPGSLQIARGETVRMVFTNTGSVAHEAIVGDKKTQDKHESEMNMKGGMHHESDAISVEPGKTKELSYKAEKAGSVLIGCHEPGHYDDGMKIDLTVT